MADPNLISEAMRTAPTLLGEWNILVPMLGPLVVAAVSVMFRGKDRIQFSLALFGTLIALAGSVSLFFDVWL